MIKGFLFRKIFFEIGKTVRYYFFQIIRNPKEWNQLTSPETEDFWEKDLTQNIYNNIVGIAVLVFIALVIVCFFE